MKDQSTRELICCHYVSMYLPLNCVWIYNTIINLKAFRSLVLTRTILNENRYGTERVVSLSQLDKVKYYYNFLVFKTIGYFPLFYRKCKSEKVSVLHAHFGYNGIKILGLKKKLNIPMACSFYGNDAYLWTNKKKYCDRLKVLFQSCEQILVLGPHMKTRLIELGCPEQKISIHHLGVDIEKIRYCQRKIDKPPIRFLMTSSFIDKKGIDIALRALSIIKGKIDFTVDVIGDGPLKNDLMALTYELKLMDNIKYHGYRDYSFFLELALKCQVFLQASRTAKNGDKEGTPMSLVDVMATGMPVISTLHSDIPEIVIDGVTGFLAEENNPQDFAVCILKLLNNADEFKNISINTRNHIIANFNIRTQMEKLEQKYRKLISNK